MVDRGEKAIIATPHGFRPTHFEFVIQEGSDVFMEKPLSCDGTGTRRILEAGREESRKKLKVVIGLQNRYDPAN